MPGSISRINNGTAFSREEVLKVRTLYLAKGWTSSEIAAKLGKETRQVTAMVNRRGWAKRRREIEEKAAALAEQAAIVDAKEFVESVAVRAEELTHKGFDVAEKMADDGDAIGFSAAMSGAKTAVGLVRQALGIDATQNAGVSVTLNAVFGAPVASESEPKPVEKVAPDPRTIEDGETLDFAE